MISLQARLFTLMPVLIYINELEKSNFGSEKLECFTNGSLPIIYKSVRIMCMFKTPDHNGTSVHETDLITKIGIKANVNTTISLQLNNNGNLCSVFK